MLYRNLIILMLIGQFVWLACTVPSLNILRDSYRYTERMRTEVAFATNNTPATHAAWAKEVARLEDHRDLVAWATVSVFLLVDVASVHVFWNYGRRKTTA